MKRQTLRQEAIEATYDTVREEIERVVSRFRRFARLWQDADEHDLTGVAIQGFMEAYLTYRKRKGDFARWVRYVVEQRLRDEVRNRARRHRLMKQHGEVEPSIEYDICPEALSDDAKSAITIALFAIKSGAFPSRARSMTVKVLRDSCDWPYTRIERAFEEIRLTLED